MALIMNDEQRAKALEEYNPKERLIQVGKDKQSGKAVLYYPAAWRLYELHLRYPNANFKSEIVYHDEQKGTVIVKAYLYLGKNYEESDKKAEAMKQGSIASLDKVETAAKARCARDFGIGTEYALDMVADETDATHDDASQTHQNGHQAASTGATDKSQSEALHTLIGKAKQRAWTLKLATDKPTWEALLQEATGEPLQEKDLTIDLVAKLNSHLAKVERQRTASGTVASAANGK